MPVNGQDILRIAFRAEYNGTDDMVNVFHAKITGSGSEADGDTMDAIHDWLVTIYGTFWNRVSNKVVAMDYEVYNITQDRPMGTEPIIGLGAGGSVGEELPTQTSPLIVFPTAVKKSVGKKFLPVTTVDNTTDGNILTANALADLAAMAVEWLTDKLITTLYLQGGNYNAILPRFAPWITALARTGIFTQRRRRLGKGD